MEYGFGKRANVKSKKRPPLVPLYPKNKAGMNMNLLLRYRDLKMRWKHKGHMLRMHLKRKRRLRLSWLPEPRPTCSFIPHDQMPHTKKFTEMPTTFEHLDTRNAFAIVKTSVDKQHKVTRGDLVITRAIRRKQAGDKVVFGTVLLVATADWTIIGKPTVPYARVVGTIEQQTVTKDHISFTYPHASRWSRFKRSRHYVAIIHIDEIVVDPYSKPDIIPPRPVRLLDLWANRWLDPDEMEGIKYKKDNITPVVEDIYDGREPRPNLYQTRGLTDCYRFLPDPLMPKEALFAEHYHMQSTIQDVQPLLSCTVNDHATFDAGPRRPRT